MSGHERLDSSFREPERLDLFMARANAAYYAGPDPLGGFATAPDGSNRIFETRNIVAGNEMAHHALMKALADARA